MAIVKALLSLCAVSSVVFAIEAPIPGYDVETLAWNVHLDPRDDPITLSGTIEEVTSKAKKLNPRWARDMEKRKPIRNDGARLQARDWAYRVDCVDGNRWKMAGSAQIKEGLDYLSKISAKPKIGPGPGKCSRVSCSYHAAIWWCNDKSTGLELDSFKEIVSSATSILDHCTYYGATFDLVGGQAFMPDHWNVIIREDKDHC
ncbi:hypothetical protein E4U17_002564 [Claviceps sp. LM77 group G4]|nr:hypothetical protein E4U17_002564 [Claviceps sp. LM77 group G4]KAG6072611.1 hypothetical protein E4U16_005235 [Claviceps sp. LM84 group G4]KAG6074405.1 hypothetical protein E4U33_002524 [Claviceps sp. LM78 group G4]